MTQSKRRESYKNPPIEEALVEFRFASTDEWDLTIPGKLHEKVKEIYPGKPRQQKVVQATVQAAQGQRAGIAVQEGVVRVQLVDGDARRLVSLGPDVLSVNVLRPYEGWAHFKPRIDGALRAYVDVSGADGVSRIGVRYINKVVIPGVDLDIREYFLCGPGIPAGLPKHLGGFLDRAEHVFDDGVKLLLTFASIDGEDGRSAFLLDLDLIWEGPRALDVDSALRTVDDLHRREGDAFEAVITNKTRELFDAA